MNLGNTIRVIRKDKGLSQGEFASICGITQTYLSQIENNQKEPNLSTLKTISDTLGVPLPILFYMSITDDDIPVDKRKTYELLNPSVKALINEFFAIS